MFHIKPFYLQEKIETEPYVLDIEELGQVLDEQEALQKIMETTDSNQMDTFLLEEVLVSKPDPAATVKRSTEAKQSNQVCLYFGIFQHA